MISLPRSGLRNFLAAIAFDKKGRLRLPGSKAWEYLAVHLFVALGFGGFCLGIYISYTRVEPGLRPILLAIVCSCIPVMAMGLVILYKLNMLILAVAVWLKEGTTSSDDAAKGHIVPDAKTGDKGVV